jgi:molybdopterin biosynthesis enzyme
MAEIRVEIFHPIAHKLAERCDACLRIGGASAGADGMVKLAESLGQQLFYRVEDVPGCA